jgi:hypothetical protein
VRRLWIAGLLAVLAPGCARLASGQQQLAQQARIKDAVSAYEAARAGADALTVCVRAGIVAAAYADARDAPNQQAWTARRREDCARAYAAMGSAAPQGAPPLDQATPSGHIGAR